MLYSKPMEEAEHDLEDVGLAPDEIQSQKKNLLPEVPEEAPVAPGGMVETAVKELGAVVLDVKPVPSSKDKTQ